MGPSAQAPADLVQRWVAAKTQLKQDLTFAAEDVAFFQKRKLILVNPRTGLPVYWEPRLSCSANSKQLYYFFNTETKRKQWWFPKGSDVLRFARWFEGVLEVEDL